MKGWGQRQPPRMKDNHLSSSWVHWAPQLGGRGRMGPAKDSCADWACKRQPQTETNTTAASVQASVPGWVEAMGTMQWHFTGFGGFSSESVHFYLLKNFWLREVLNTKSTAGPGLYFQYASNRKDLFFFYLCMPEKYLREFLSYMCFGMKRKSVCLYVCVRACACESYHQQTIWAYSSKLSWSSLGIPEELWELCRNRCPWSSWRSVPPSVNPWFWVPWSGRA